MHRVPRSSTIILRDRYHDSLTGGCQPAALSILASSPVSYLSVWTQARLSMYSLDRGIR